MSSSNWRRPWLAVAMLMVVAMAFQPLLHLHPLTGDDGHGLATAVQCDLCAHTHAEPAAAGGAIVGLAVLAEPVAAVPVRGDLVAVAPLLPARAPPAA